MCPARSTTRGAGASLFSDTKCACLIVVLHVRQQRITKMSFACCDNVIDALPADRTDQPFSKGLPRNGAGSSKRSASIQANRNDNLRPHLKMPNHLQRPGR